MKKEIQKRIEQIRRGEVPEGYKKTQNGISPADWAVCNMGDIYSERKEPGDPTLPILTVSIHSGVSNGELDESELGKKVKRIEDKTKYLTARKGDLVFNMMRAWQGAVGVVRTDGLVSPAYIVANPNKQVYPSFINEYMMLPSTINRLHKQSYGVTDFRLRLYWDSFAKIDCCLPSLPEQEKIAEILATQDRVIELCEKKVEQLKKLKRVFLQKMFPKPGASVPEWRFPGFSGAWEMRRFGDFMAEFSNKTKKENEYPLLSSTNKGMELRNGRVSGESNIGYKIIEDEDLVLSPQNLWLGNINVNRIGKGIVSPSYKTFKITGVFTSFVEAQLKRKHFLEVYKNASTLGASVVRRNLDMDLFFEIEMLFPSPIEQKKVGDFFAEINNLITLHQCKCDEEKQKKKALMQLLLTGIVRVRI